MNVSMQDVRQALHELGGCASARCGSKRPCIRIVQTTHAIFAVDGASLMLANAEHHLLNAAVSDPRMKHLEELQIRHQEGPCISASRQAAGVRRGSVTGDPLAVI